MSAACHAAVHVVGMTAQAQVTAPTGTTEQLRDRASISLLARTAGTLPADLRVDLVHTIQTHGPWAAVREMTSTSARRGKLGAAARRVGNIIATRGWVDAELALADTWAEDGIRMITPGDTEWMPGLDDLGTLTPIALWVRGRIPDLNDGAISIVGSRDLSILGHSRIDRAVVGLPVPVISGLAIGADETVHRAALLHGVPTIAVLPSGVDRPYPATNQQLSERIVESAGALISEIPPGLPPVRHRFLDRNRIIAALGTGSLIVEAGTISGTMNQAGHATRLGRRLAAFPGAPGTDQLIASGLAYPALSRTDIDALYDSDIAAS